MALITDLPPEVRLKIYEFLLVDPIRDGLRITLTFDPLDSTKKTWARARCVQSDQPHKEGHSAHPCQIDVSPFTLHHLNFTDLLSLASANKTLYLEVSQTMYNNSDLTYSFGQLPPAAKVLKSSSAFTPLGRYFDQHSSMTCAMLISLVIHDGPAIMTPRDTKTIVDLVNFRLPNLRVFGYQIDADTAVSRSELSRGSYRRISRSFRIL
ncbi:unnamed protein product [Aureobasidium uvarum]|uniref:Uncharacterized protein n=1 Tax=Aureobasidium uvarum TaxID=2773716 RepID=A0A9N8PQ00_9PEZI|nr:unnamed protein product [Aureobasidium uvarum]